MASVALINGWLTPADPALPAVELRIRQVKDNRVKPGQVRRYVNGRRRGTTQAGRDNTIDIESGLIPLSKVDELDALLGVTVFYRDEDGRGIWCQFYDAPSSPLTGVGLTKVSLTLTEVTDTDEV